MSAPLQPVSFRKGRESKPRLSAPYVPGKHHERFWTEDEIQLLRDHYEDKGIAYCGMKLPNRDRGAIYAMANKLGLKRGGRTARVSRKQDYPALDAAILAAWPEMKGRGAVKALAEKLGQPRWLVSNRARRLGLTLPHRKEPPWTEAETALLNRVPLHDPDRAAEIFKAHGFHRTPTAIIVRCKRVGLSRRFAGAMTARKAAAILGIDSKTMTVWILEGLVKAGRRGTKRLPQQGGDAHTIEPAELRRFVIDNLERIDFRKVEAGGDKFALVSLLTAPPAENEAAE